MGGFAQKVFEKGDFLCKAASTTSPSAPSACGARGIPAQRRAVLFSSDLDLDARTLYRSYKARFQIEYLFRDANQFTSLSTCQARSPAKLHFHFNASLSALTFCKLEARHQDGDAGFSMASLKRRAFNQHLLEHISQHLAQGHSLEKSSPDYQDLCDDGTLNHRAA